MPGALDKRLMAVAVVIYVSRSCGLCLRTQLNRILSRFLLLRRYALMSAGRLGGNVKSCLIRYGADHDVSFSYYPYRYRRLIIQEIERTSGKRTINDESARNYVELTGSVNFPRLIVLSRKPTTKIWHRPFRPTPVSSHYDYLAQFIDRALLLDLHSRSSHRKLVQARAR